MLELAYPALPINEWFITKPARHTLWRWLLISLMLHVLILLSWELTHFAQINAVLPVQAGQQAVSVRLVSAASVQPKTADTQPVIVAANTENETAIQAKPVPHKMVTQKVSKLTPLQNNKGDAAAAVAVAANLTEGVYSEATPQSSHKPEYPRMAILKKQQGKVVIKLDIDESGQTHNIKILKSSGFALLDNAVIVFAQMERFIPATQNNSPVKTTQQYSFLFKLI